ncbi:unnamed protein product [Symbiodinium microadriaticum]|nr:unnamed protein product [Symbiodinium microadriaticum]
MHPKGEPPLPGSIEDTEPDVPQPTMLVPGPMQAHEVACSQKFEKAGKAGLSWPPALARDGWEQFQNRKLPGDDLVCLRYRTQRNWRWAVFVPSLVLSMATDSPVLCHETRREQVTDGNQTRLECPMGQPATDLFTKDSFCPVVCGFSNMHWTPIWYSLFLATVVYCSFRGRWVDADRYWARKASNLAKYIGCWRAGYSDRHLQVIFILLTLCAVHSVLVRFAATPEVGGFDNACVRYGDWDGVEDVCKPGAYLEQGWPVFLLIYSLCFFGALLDQGVIGMKQLRRRREAKLNTEGRQKTWEKFVDTFQPSEDDASGTREAMEEMVIAELYKFSVGDRPMPKSACKSIVRRKLAGTGFARFLEAKGLKLKPSTTKQDPGWCCSRRRSSDVSKTLRQDSEDYGDGWCCSRRRSSDVSHDSPEDVWWDFEEALRKNAGKGKASTPEQVRAAFQLFAADALSRGVAGKMLDSKLEKTDGGYRFPESSEAGGIALPDLMAWEQEMLDKWADFDEIEVDRLTKAAVELKALVHHQMHVIQEDTKRENSDLANAMLLGVDAIRFLMGADEVDEQDSEFNLIDDFDKRLDEIEQEADGLRGPEVLLSERANLETRLLGDPGISESQAAQKDFSGDKLNFSESASKMSKVDMFKLYWFCPIVQSFKEAPAVKSGQRRPLCMSIRAHHVLGAIFGICGFALMISLAPQGDSFTITYYFVDKPALVEGRCRATTSAVTPPSPWCIADTEKVVTLTRWTLPPYHGVPDSTPLVWLCLMLKAVITCMFGGLFGVTVFKTVEGLRLAQHPMKILDFILMRWIHKQQFSTAQLQAWSMARASVLHNDVRFLLDRFEQVVMSLLIVCLILTTDAVVQYIVWSKPPNLSAAYVIVVFAVSTWICINAAVGCHYAQQNHLKTLVEMKEASLLQAVGPDLDYVRSFIDVMVKRLSSGGDYQTKMFYMPLNPVLQKTLLAYFFTSVLAAQQVLGPRTINIPVMASILVIRDGWMLREVGLVCLLAPRLHETGRSRVFQACVSSAAHAPVGSGSI